MEFRFPSRITSILLRDFIMLPFGHAKKWDLQKVSFTAVSTDGLHISTNGVPVIFTSKSERKPFQGLSSAGGIRQSSIICVTLSSYIIRT
jgi:hypothetical protein